MGRRDNDFTSAVRRSVAERAGYICSFPECGSSTIGPSPSNPSGSLANGVACHIYPASAKGPRGTELQVGIDVSAESNAIWMCETHGSLIDKNGGRDFPATLLMKWKENGEVQAALRQQQESIPLPRLDALAFNAQRLVNMTLGEMRIEFAQFTVVEANDALPLSLIARCLAFAPEQPDRLAKSLLGSAIDFRVLYSPGYKQASRTALEPSRLRYWDGDSPRDSIAGFYHVSLVDMESLRSMIMSGEELDTEPEDPDPDRVLTGSAHSDPLIAEKIAQSLKNQDTIVVRDIRREEKGWTVNCLSHEYDAYFPIPSLSGTEQKSVHLDLVIAAIRLRGEAPLVLIIDNMLYGYDDAHLQRFNEVCHALPMNVQVILTDSTRSLGPKLGWHTETLILDDSSFPSPIRLVRDAT